MPISAPMRTLLLLAVGAVAGLTFTWLLRVVAKPSNLIRLPRAYTDIFRSSSRGVPARGTVAGPAPGRVIEPAARVVSAGVASKAAAAAPAAAAAETAPEAEAPAAPKKKRVRRVVTEDTPAGGAPAQGPDNKESRRTIKAVGVTPAPPTLWGKESLIPQFCDDVERYPEEPVEWDVVEEDEVDGEAHKCHLANVSHWQLKYYHGLDQLKICTHDPTVDTVISDHLHKWSFWGSPDEWMVLLNAGPCTPERPYMLDIGSNLGIFSIIGAERGCHAVAFEPLAENIHRLYHSAKVNGFSDRIMLMKHAVGKYFTDVTIGFRPSNPGASGINLGGSKTETVQQITIDGLLLGKNPPAFKDAASKGLPPITGQYIGFVKVDTEGYDVAVVAGMMKTFIEGRVPLMLIEFGPGDAAGTAGCDPAEFARTMYANGYSLWEWGRRVPLDVLVNDNIPAAVNGTGRRVFEAWYIRDDFVDKLAKKQPDGTLKLAEG